MARRCMLGLAEAWRTVVVLYTSGHVGDCRSIATLLVLCTTVSLALSALLFLSLHTIKVDLNISGIVAGVFFPLLAVALFISRRVRCASLLLIACSGTKQCRNVLLACGTILLAESSARNIFSNLLAVMHSIMCNRERLMLSLNTTPIDNYIKMIRWLNDKLHSLINFGVVSFEAKVHVSHTVESADLEQKLRLIEQELARKANGIEAVFDLVWSVGQKIAPVVNMVLLLILTIFFIRAYMRNSKYKNMYITSRFVQYDQQQKAMGRAHVLPLTRQEERRYVSIPCLKPRFGEGRRIAMFFIPVGTHILLWGFLMGLDALVYWVIIVMNNHLGMLEPLNVPLILYVNGEHHIIFMQVPGENKMEDFSFSVTLFERDCLPTPTLLLSKSAGPAAAILVSLVFLGLLSVKLLQMKLLVSEQFYTEMADDRVKNLHAKILRQRAKKKAEVVESARFRRLTKTVKFWLPILDFCRRKKERVFKLP
ncbi:dendritic cell-specific transmembrane protein-like isoform X2 [Brachyhypopomus gauderio]